MNRQALLTEAITTIARHSGIKRPVFQLTCVSPNATGFYLMQTEARQMWEKIASAVSGFPADPQTSCVALMPDMVDEIIRASQRVYEVAR